MTLTEAKAALAAKLNIDIASIASNGLFAESDLEYWINAGIQAAWDYKPWPFTQKTKTTTTVDDDYYDHPTDLMPHSIFRLSVDDESFGEPIRFEDYIEYKEQEPSGTEKLWALHENFVFVNKNAYTVGTAMDMTGKKFPPYLSTGSSLLPFSPTTDNQEHSGNNAIVLLAYAESLASDKLKRASEGLAQEKRAYGILDLLWKPYARQRAFQHSTKPMFEIPDYFHGGNRQHPIGNFDLNN